MTIATATEPVSATPAGDRLEQAGLAGVDLLALLSRFETIGAWRHVLATGHSYWTPGMYDIFGMPYSPAPANLIMAMQRYHADDRGPVLSIWEESLRQRKSFICTVRIRHGEDYRLTTCVGEHRLGELAQEEMYGVVWLTPGAEPQARLGA